MVRGNPKSYKRCKDRYSNICSGVALRELHDCAHTGCLHNCLEHVMLSSDHTHLPTYTDQLMSGLEQSLQTDF